MGHTTASKNADVARPPAPDVFYQFVHHHTVRTAQGGAGGWFPTPKVLVGAVRVANLEDVPGWSSDMNPVEDVGHLSQRECIALDGQRPVDRPDAVAPPEPWLRRRSADALEFAELARSFPKGEPALLRALQVLL